MRHNPTSSQLRELYEAGSSIREIAEWIDSDYSTVRSRLLCAGTVMRRRGSIRKYRLPLTEKRKTIDLYLSGMLVKEIADILGIKPNSVHARLRGIHIRRRMPSTANVSISDYHYKGR